MSKGRSSELFSARFLIARFAKNHHKNLRTWGPGMSKTLYHRINPLSTPFGSSVTRPFTFSTRGKNKWIPQPYRDESLSICSTMQSSVPWRRSRKGDTTTICKQVSVCLWSSPGFLNERNIFWKFRNSEQNAKHQPKIAIQDEVLVSSEAIKAHWKDQ